MVLSLTCERSVTNPSRTEGSQDIPISKVDTIDRLRLGESESRSKKSKDAGSEGQEASHFDRE